jgi:hypothetical protein
MNESLQARGEDEAAESGSSQMGEKVAVDLNDEPVQHIHAKTIILLIVSGSLSTSHVAN